MLQLRRRIFSPCCFQWDWAKSTESTLYFTFHCLISIAGFSCLFLLLLRIFLLCTAEKSSAFTLPYETFHANSSLCFRVYEKSNHFSSLDRFIHICSACISVVVSFAMSAAQFLGTGSESLQGHFFTESFLSLLREQSCSEMPHWGLISEFTSCKCWFWESQR